MYFKNVSILDDKHIIIANEDEWQDVYSRDIHLSIILTEEEINQIKNITNFEPANILTQEQKEKVIVLLNEKERGSWSDIEKLLTVSSEKEKLLKQLKNFVHIEFIS